MGYVLGTPRTHRTRQNAALPYKVLSVCRTLSGTASDAKSWPSSLTELLLGVKLSVLLHLEGPVDIRACEESV